MSMGFSAIMRNLFAPALSLCIISAKTGLKANAYEMPMTFQNKTRDAVGRIDTQKMEDLRDTVQLM